MDFDGKPQSLLTFRVGPVFCCAPSLPVRSIITPPKLTHPPGSDSSQPGIFKHGSHIVKVIDLRQKFGIDEAEQTQPGNLIITLFEKGSFAFWVDQILDVFDFPSEGWGNVPAAIPRGVFTRTLLLNKKIHLYSEFEKLASIQDLGYLKHYIQQLKEQSEKKTEPKKADVPSTLKPSKPLSENSRATVNTLSSANKITEQTKLQVSTQPLDKNTQQTATTKHLPKTDTKNEVDKPVERRINSRPLTQHAPKTETASLENATQSSAQNNIQSTTQSKIVKSTYAPPRQSKANSEIKVAEPVASDLKTQYKVDEYKPEIHSSKTLSNAEQESEKESSSIGIIIFFLLMFCLFGVGLYYLLPEEVTTTSKYGGFVKQNVEDNSEFIFQPKPQKSDDTPEIFLDKKPVEKSANNISTDKKFSNESLTKKSTSLETVPPDEITNTEKSNDLKEELSYRADISKQDNEITITLHQPIATVEIGIKKETVVEQKIESEIKEETIANVAPVEQLNIEKPNLPIAKEKIINEVIHTVVKGDTLWAIAKNYVNNPFLYPELARLSNIKNPHRIYPGNRVRIRFIK